MSALTKITSTEQLQHVLTSSSDRPVLLFKHSTRCPISARANQEVLKYLGDQPNENVTYGLIHVVEDRPVSLKAADLLQVKHESPQAILVEDGRAVWNTSHSGITADVLKEILQK
ncbi:general stress protein [Paenibacillus yonginensis]|uniref:General stress protein n=1 Tax=Paenibacillus yonginensis TaxID=1462996 RepID=A0A1B1N0U2_9BACL|nr:bacillithiol system redox-active protein YtxJ [Paenibacillus yonginensis]ANS75028.1 general stress protein [Paenibacillus yonginensis]